MFLNIKLDHQRRLLLVLICIKKWQVSDQISNISHPGDVCASEPCIGGSRCYPRNDSYHCVCSSGLTGSHCDQPVAELGLLKGSPCDGSTCVEGQGQCEELDGSYFCSCKTSFMGPRCEQRICQQIRCKDTSKCEAKYEDSLCFCLPELYYQDLSCYEMDEVCLQNLCKPRSGPCWTSTYGNLKCACRGDTDTVCQSQPISLLCQYNCNGSIINPNMASEFKVSCLDCGIGLNVPLNWLIKSNEGKIIFTSSNFTSSDTIHISPGILPDQGTVALNVKLEYNSNWVFAISTPLTITERPDLGECSVSPATGYQVTTSFLVACTKWQGTEDTTVVIYQSVNKGQKVFLKTVSSEVDTFPVAVQLTAGLSTKQYFTQVLIKAIDRNTNYASNLQVIAVRVLPMTNILAAEQYVVLTLQEQGLNFVDMALVASVLDIVDRNVSSSSVNEMFNKIHTTPYTTVLSALTALNVMDTLLSFKRSDLHAVQASLALNTSVKILAYLLKQFNTMDMETKEDVIISFLGPLSSITEISLDGVRNFNKTDKSRQLYFPILKKIPQLIFELQDTLLRSFPGVDYKPFVISGNNMTLVVYKSHSINLAGYSVKSDIGAITLPGIEENDLGISIGDCYELRGMIYLQRPHITASEFQNKDNLKAPGFELQLKPCGSPEKVGNKSELKSPFLSTMETSYTVKMVKPNFDLYENVAILSVPGELLYHVVPASLESSLDILIVPVSVESLNVYISFDRQPSRENYEFEYVPKRSAQVESNTYVISAADIQSQKVKDVIVGIGKNCIDGAELCPNQVSYKYLFHSVQCTQWVEEVGIWRKSSKCHIVENRRDYVTFKPGEFGTTSSMIFIPSNQFTPSEFGGELNQGSSTNYAVIVVVIVVFAIYLQGLVISRSLDIMDRRLWKTVVIEEDGDGEAENLYKYEIQIHTGNRRGAEKNFKLDVNLHGHFGSTGFKTLDSENKTEVTFPNHSVKSFLISSKQEIGKVDGLDIQAYTDDHVDLQWHLNMVVVIDMQHYFWYPFIYQQWIHIKKSDPEDEKFNIHLDIFNEKLHSENIFKRKWIHYFFNKHSLVSPFYGSSKTTFTRMQRWACFMFMIVMLMLCNTLWVNTSLGKGTTKLSIGSLKIPVQALVVMPCSILVVTVLAGLLVIVFRKCKVSKEDQKNITRAPAILNTSAVLPHQVTYIVHTVVILTIIASSVLGILFSLEWENDTIYTWLIALFSGLFLNIFVLQPLQVTAWTCCSKDVPDLAFYRTMFSVPSGSDFYWNKLRGEANQQNESNVE